MLAKEEVVQTEVNQNAVICKFPVSNVGSEENMQALKRIENLSFAVFSTDPVEFVGT